MRVLLYLPDFPGHLGSAGNVEGAGIPDRVQTMQFGSGFGVPQFNAHGVLQVPVSTDEPQ